ncbi:hypothetical protein APHAL10511_002870 [Amanita phalloides]|nr:hypothetical protein APHAL10511_002870 [Amanita phalloides]
MVNVFTVLLIFAVFSRLALANTNFAQCLISLRSGIYGSDGARYSNGTSVALEDLGNATAITYSRCVEICGGHGPEAFSWRTFSLQFTSWFLPWLALMSQLPYGAKDTLSNFLALVLTVGSPILAAYSLALAVISNRWMVKRFARSTLPHASLAAQALRNLQQVSVHVPQEQNILPSLVVLKENFNWWQTLSHGLDYSVPKWTLAAIMSMLYVLLADAFSWISTLGSDLTNSQANTTGESVGSLWLCLLPIVVGYLQLSPKSDSDRIKRAFDNANRIYFLAVDSEEPIQGHGSLAFNIEKVSRDIVHEDEMCSAPVFFYARVFKWIQLARQVTDSFDAASQRSHQRLPTESPPRTRSEVIAECTLRDGSKDGHSYEIFSIFARSACLALFLQWGTASAAIMSMYLTPARGFGCRSGSYLFYGLLATIIWLFSLISSILVQSYMTAQQHSRTTTLAYVFSIIFRHLAKALAAINTLWLFTSSLLQFSNLFDTCYCNASVLGRGSHSAYTVLAYTPADASAVKLAWAGGMILSSAVAISFILIINMLRKRAEITMPFS